MLCHEGAFTLWELDAGKVWACVSGFAIPSHRSLKSLLWAVGAAAWIQGAIWNGLFLRLSNDALLWNCLV
jgi:hypothetical protein